MKLRRQKRKTSKALDGLASITKIWSDGRIQKTAGRGVAKAKSLRPPSKIKKMLSYKAVRVTGIVAVVGGAGGALFSKLRPSKPEPAYTPPKPTEPVAAPAPVADPPPLAVAPDPSAVSTMPTVAGAEEAPTATTATDDGAPEAPADEEPAADVPAAEDTPAEEPAAEEPTPAEDSADDDDAAEKPAG